MEREIGEVFEFEGEKYKVEIGDIKDEKIATEQDKNTIYRIKQKRSN